MNNINYEALCRPTERMPIMVITANGKPIDISGEITIKQLLDEANVEMQEYVSVQLDGEIIARDAFDKTLVKEGAVVEFLYYMGGGNFVW